MFSAGHCAPLIAAVLPAPRHSTTPPHPAPSTCPPTHTHPPAACDLPQFSVQLEAAKALNFPRIPGQAEAEAHARELVRCGGRTWLPARAGQLRCIRWVPPAGIRRDNTHPTPPNPNPLPRPLSPINLSRKRAKQLMEKGYPADTKDDASLPLNAQLLQTTLGVTSEGFQVLVRAAAGAAGGTAAEGWAGPGAQ